MKSSKRGVPMSKITAAVAVKLGRVRVTSGAGPQHSLLSESA